MKVWWVSWRGELRHQEEKPSRKGWSATTDPEQAPANYASEEDYYLHLVLTPSGSPRYVRLQRSEDGHSWSVLEVLTQAGALALAHGAREVYGVPNEDGKPHPTERWK